MRISDWSSDVCSSDLEVAVHEAEAALLQARAQVEALKATYAQKQAALSSTQADLTFRRSDDNRIKALQAVGSNSQYALASPEQQPDLASSHLTSPPPNNGTARAQTGVSTATEHT